MNIQHILWYYDPPSPNWHNNFSKFFPSKSLGKSTIVLFYINSFGQNWPNLPISWSPGKKILWPNFLIVINHSHASPGLIDHSYTDFCSFFDISHFTHVTFIYHLSDFRQCRKRHDLGKFFDSPSPNIKKNCARPPVLHACLQMSLCRTFSESSLHCDHFGAYGIIVRWIF